VRNHMSLLIRKRVGQHCRRSGELKKLIHFSTVRTITCKVPVVANQARIMRLLFLIEEWFVCLSC